MLPDESSEKLNDALRLQAGLLTPDEIKQRRQALGLSQEQLAVMLQIDPAIVGRWEDGGQIQQRAMNRLLVGLFQVPELRAFYKQLDENAASEGRLNSLAGASD
jgi:DNA-binding transcriptional regulator YiaG